MNTWSFVGQNLAGKVITCACMYPFVGQNLAGKVRLVLQTSGITGIPSLRNQSEHVKNTIHWFGIHRVSQTVTSQSEHVKSTIHWFGMY